MKKRLLSLLLVLAVVFSFSLSAFATDTGIDIIDDVDKLLRDVTHTVIQCNKVWRFQLWASYDAWEMENATNAEMIKPLRRGLWFVLDRDYNAYDTLAVVDNLQKKFEEGDILTESEIISNQAPAGPLGLEVASKPTKKAQRRISGQIKR